MGHKEFPACQIIGGEAGLAIPGSVGLSDRTRSLGGRARSLGGRARSLGGRARSLGGRARSLGGRALSLLSDKRSLEASLAIAGSISIGDRARRCGGRCQERGHSRRHTPLSDQPQQVGHHLRHRRRLVLGGHCRDLEWRAPVGRLHVGQGRQGAHRGTLNHRHQELGRGVLDLARREDGPGVARRGGEVQDHDAPQVQGSACAASRGHSFSPIKKITKKHRNHIPNKAHFCVFFRKVAAW